MNKVKISPSILSADFGDLNKDIKTVEPYVDMLHIDVMDGHFVPNLSFGVPVVKGVKTKLPLDVDLMVYNPENYYEDYVKLGADCIHVHAESVKHLHRQVALIKSLGVKASVAINPGTALCAIEEVLPDLDRVLIMAVNPGFGGQVFIENVLPKIKKLRNLYPKIEIEVDGGINAQTAKLVVEAGANILVSGSYLFKSKNRKVAIESLRVG